MREARCCFPRKTLQDDVSCTPGPSPKDEIWPFEKRRVQATSGPVAETYSLTFVLTTQMPTDASSIPQR